MSQFKLVPCLYGDLLLSFTLSATDEDKSIMTEQIEDLPLTKSFTRTPVVADRPAKRGPTKGRGYPGTSDCKVSRKMLIHHPPTEEKMKKKGSCSVLTFSGRTKITVAIKVGLSMFGGGLDVGITLSLPLC